MSMKKVVVKYINIMDNDLGILTTKEASLYLKKKYIGKWNLNKKNKPIKDGVYFNISHSHDMIIFAQAQSDIGVDVEKVRQADDKLKRYVSNDEEFKTINSNEDFFKVWISKESLVKAQGTGIDKRPENIPALPLIGVKEYNGVKYTSNQVKLGDYIIAVTIMGDEGFDIEVEKE